MKKLLFALLAVAVSPPLSAQTSGTITSNQLVCIGVSADHSTVGVQVTGTWTGTLQPQVAIQGQTLTNSQVVPSTSTTPAATITANGVYYANVGSASQFCILGNTVSSGSAVVFLNAAKGVNASALGGGGGLPTGSVVNSVVQTGLMAQYQFNEGSGTTLTDASGNGNNATFGGGCAANPTWVTGGLQFVGNSSQCVVLPQALSTAHTIQVFAARGPYCDSCSLTAVGSTGGSWAPLIGTTGDPGSGVTHGLAISAYTNQWGSAGAGGTAHIGNGAFKTTSLAGAIGNHLFTSVLDSTTDHVYFDTTEAVYGAQTGSYGIQLASQNFTFGGYNNGAAEGFSNTTYYYALFYSTELTAAQVAQNYYAILSTMQNRGIQTAPSKPFVGTSNALVLVGDSITAGLAGTTCCTVDSYTTTNLGYSGAVAWDFTVMSDWRDDGFLPKGSSKNIWTYMIGSNAATAVTTVAQAATQWGYEVPVVRNRKAAGWKTIALTIPSHTGAGGDAGKNLLNNYLRQHWAEFFDGFSDIAAQPDLGADGASANPSGTFFNADGVHLVTNGDVLISNLLARTIDRLWAPKDFNSATTYTTTAPAATAITAASESVNTATITSTLNPPVGSDVIIAGVTPAGYNTSATNKCYVATTAAGNFTCVNGTSGLGAGSVFGTASVPTQKNQDTYVILGGSATSPSFTLQSCVGYTGQNFYFKNTNTTSPWVLTPFQSSETIDGAATLTMPTATSGNNPVVVLQSQLVSASAGGCTWKRLQ